MKKVIIGIHGLGNKPEKELLHEWWTNAMYEGLNLIGVQKKLPEFELVYWADILHEKPLDASVKDKNDPYYIDEPYCKSTEDIHIEHHSFRQKIIDFVTEQLNKIFLNDDKTLNYSFITDVILKNYFTDLNLYYAQECTDENNVACQARHLIRNRVLSIINKFKSNYEIMIVAHSMGSIVAFDVMKFLIPEVEINTLVTIGSPLGLPIVISKIATEQKTHSPNSNDNNIMSTPPGVTTNWFNLADIMDNVALNYKLADDFTENSRGIAPIDYLVSNNYHVNGEKNPHKSFGYLRTPEFAGILSDFIGEPEQNIGQKIRSTFKNVVDKVKEQGEIVKDKLNLN